MVNSMNVLKAECGSGYRVMKTMLESDIQRRLEALGLTEGTALEILNKKRNGSAVIKVRGTRFAIGRDIAEGIFIDKPEVSK